MEEIEKVYARLIRGTNEDTLSELVEKMKKVSRITNAIYLQQGLIDGTIPPDDLLTDILKLKFTKSSDVVEMDSAKMKAGVDSLKTLAQSIKPTDAMKQNLKYYLALNEIHDAVGEQTDGGEWPEANNIKTIVTNFKDNDIAFSAVDKLLGYVISLDNEVVVLKMPPDFVNRGGLSKLHSAFVNIEEKGQKLIDEAKLISQEHVDYKSINNIESVLPSLAVVLQKVKAVRKCKENSSLLGRDLNAEAANFESFKKIDNFSKDDQKIQVMVISELRRQSNSGRSLQYSFPFMDSGNNIVGLSDALKDPWMKSVFKSDSFPESLEQISSLGELLRNINDGLVMKDKISLESQNFFETIDLVSSVVYNSQKAEDIAKRLTECEKDISRNQLQLDEIEELLKQSRQFDKATKDLKQKLADFVEVSKSQGFQKVLSEVVEISRKCTSLDSNVVKAVFQEYEQYADLKNFVNSISRLKEAADKLIELKKTLKEKANKVHSKADEINTFKTAFTPFSKGFDCLASVKNTESLIEMVLLAQNVASLTTLATGFNEIDKFIDKVSKVIPEIKTVKTGMDGIKGKKTPASDALNNLHNQEIHSKTIGSATQGIVNMFTVLEKRTDFEGLKSELSLIQQESQKVSLDPKDLENLDKLATIESDISMMYQTLDTWKSSLKDPKSATLADYFPILSHAKGVSEITLDFHETATSLQTLIDMVSDPGVKDKLMTAQSHVKEMASVGMKFSDYSKAFDNSKNTLSDLDTFFVNYDKSAPPPGSSWRSLETSTLPVAVARSRSSLLSKNFMIGFYCGEFIFICLSICGHVAFWRWYRKKKLKLNKMELKLNKMELKLNKMELKRRTQKDKSLNKPAWERIQTQAAQKKINSGIKDGQNVNERELDTTQSMSSERVSPNRIKQYVKTATDELIHKLTKTQIADENKSVKRATDTKTDDTTSEKQKKSIRSMDCYTYFWDFVNWSMKTACIKEKSEKGSKSRFSNNEKEMTFKFPNKDSMILSKSPLNKSESESFWKMIKEKKVRDIAMLCMNDGKEAATEKIEIFCHQYFPKESTDHTLKFGDFEIKCISRRDDEFPDLLVKRTLQVSYKSGKSTVEKFKVNNYQYNWNPNSPKPLSPSIMAEMLRKWRRTETPILVHGKNDEKGPSEALAFMELLCREFKQCKGKIEYHEVLGDLREKLPNALNNCFIFGFSIIASFVLLYGENTTSDFIKKLLVEYILGATFQENERKERNKKAKKLKTADKLWEREEQQKVQLNRNRLMEKQPEEYQPFVMVDMLCQGNLWDDDDKNKKETKSP